jgi:hypothetical protein
MLRTLRIGSVQTQKEKLAVAIIELLRNIAPESGYNFREISTGDYQLKLYWGNENITLAFSETEAQALEDEAGREALRGQLTAAIVEMLHRQKISAIDISHQ